MRANVVKFQISKHFELNPILTKGGVNDHAEKLLVITQ